MAIKLKGHETFALREGWLNKGLAKVDANPKVFSENYGADALGVGSNMAKAIRYWLKAGKFMEEPPKEGAKLTDIGQIIFKEDKYLKIYFHYGYSILIWQEMRNLQQAGMLFLT